MTSKNMTPRKVVAVAPSEDDLYLVADDGTLWSAINNGTAWKQMPPLPPREDEESSEPPALVESMKIMEEQNQTMISDNAKLREEASILSDGLFHVKESLKVAQLQRDGYLADLRRVREAVREYLSLGPLVLTTWDARKCLEAINKEPMP